MFQRQFQKLPEYRIIQRFDSMTFNQVVAGSSPAWLMGKKMAEIQQMRGFPPFFCVFKVADCRRK